MRQALERAVRIARTETVRHARQQREQPWRVFFELFLVVFVTLVVVGRIPGVGLYPEPGAYYYGQVAASESPGAALDTARGFVGIVFVIVTLVTMLWTMKAQDWREQADGLLTTVPIPTLVAGDLLSKILKVGRFLSVASLAGAIAFASGSESVLGGVLFVLAAFALASTATAVGYTAGLAGLALASYSSFVREHRVLVGSPLVALYFGLFVGSRRASAVLGGLPIGWYADIPMTAATGTGVTTAGAALLGTTLGGVSLWWTSARLAERAWLGDGVAPASVESSARSPTTDQSSRLLDRVPTTWLSRPTRAVIYAVWRRTVRAPQALLYVFLPFVLLLVIGIELAATAPASIPVLVAVYGAGAVGAGATLNPLGNEGRTLPVTMTTPGGPRHLVRGYVLSAVLVGLVPVVALVALATLGVTASPVATVAMGLFAAILTVAFVAVSVGIGAWLPEFDGLRPADSAGLTTPHVYAVFAYSLALALASVPVLGVILLQSATANIAPIAVVSGGVVTLVLSTLAGGLSYRYAVRTFESHQYGE